MNLTEFGSAVRKARIDARVTLQAMASELGVSAAFLSALEVGRKKVPLEWAAKIQEFFEARGVKVGDLREVAAVANRNIPLEEGMNPQQMMMLAGFARRSMTPEQLSKFSDLLRTVSGDD